jgi:hypothetical protein
MFDCVKKTRERHAVAVKRGNARRAKGQVIAVETGSTGNGRSLTLNGRRQPSCGGTSRMTRECQVRICEGLLVKFLGPTRRKSDSAKTWRAPPGPRSFVRGTSRWIARRSRSRMSWKLSCLPLCTRLHHSGDSCQICQFATQRFALFVKTTLSLRYGRGPCDSPHQGCQPADDPCCS